MGTKLEKVSFPQPTHLIAGIIFSSLLSSYFGYELSIRYAHDYYAEEFPRIVNISGDWGKDSSIMITLDGTPMMFIDGDWEELSICE